MALEFDFYNNCIIKMVHTRLTTKSFDNISLPVAKEKPESRPSLSVFLILVLLVGFGLFAQTSFQTYQ